MSVLFNGMAGGSSGVDTGDIGHSLRCRSAASAYLNRTFGAPTNAYGWSFSTWVKLSNLGTRHTLLNSLVDANNRGYLEINDSGILRYDDFYSGSQKCLKVSTPVYRDPTGWMHVFVLCNTDLATAEDRLQIYVNGVRVTSWSTNTNYGLSVAPMINSSGRAHYINNINGNYGDGYRARTCFVDNGIALTPSSFGYLNTEINEWVTKSQSAVKAVVDAGGTNSFMLDFDDATSLTTLGYDKSSKGNNWTLNNFSLTAGTTYDHMLDVPGNSYATLNPLDKGSVYTLANGNLAATSTAANYGLVRATHGLSAGKWYWEVLVNNASTSNEIGICTNAASLSNYIGSSSSGWSYFQNGDKITNNVNTAYGASYTTNDVIGVALDLDAGTLAFYKNGSSQGTAFSSLAAQTYFPAVGDGSNAAANDLALMFGQAPLHASATYDSAAGGYFRYTPPTGFKALCQANLPDVAIKNPKLYFDIKTRTGTAATYSVTGIGFQPDLVWSKSRGRAVDHALYDSVRGVQKQLESNSTGAETTETTGLTAFNSDGYTGGALDQINGTTATNSFVDWLWKAGGAAVSNTAGSITSQVSANVDAGFSIVTYTGTGANATVGHGLGKAPKLVIVKSRATIAGSADWLVGHNSIGWNNAYLFLNTTQATLGSEYVWGNPTGSAPTSSVINLGTSTQCNKSANPYIAYCFTDIEGYSKAFSYTGNGSADGPYVDLGFKAKFVMVKSSTQAATNWIQHDAAREPYNLAGTRLMANSANAEASDNGIDILSNGFKPRSTDGSTNTNGDTYVGFAIADVAGKYSLGR